MIADGIHEWLGGEWRELPNSPISPTAGIYASTYWHDQYYFAGIFLALGSRKVVAFDGDSLWYPLEQGLSGYYVNAIEGFGDSLYVGGFLDGIKGSTDHIGIWNGENWLPFFSEVEFIGQVGGIFSFDNAFI